MTETEKLFQDYAQACYPHLNIKPPGRLDHPSHPTSTPNPATMRSLLYTLFCALTAMVGYHIHGSVFWSIVDFFFTPLAIIKWLICHEITAQVIRDTFSWFFN